MIVEHHNPISLHDVQLSFYLRTGTPDLWKKSSFGWGLTLKSLHGFICLQNIFHDQPHLGGNGLILYAKYFFPNNHENLIYKYRLYLLFREAEHWLKFYDNIDQYHLYQRNDENIDTLMKMMNTQPIVAVGKILYLLKNFWHAFCIIFCYGILMAQRWKPCFRQITKNKSLKKLN